MNGMPFIVKATTSTGLESWIKRQSGPYRLGPREHATIFVDRGLATRAIDELPEAIRNAAKFSVEDA
jgi:hypothetical protein